MRRAPSRSLASLLALPRRHVLGLLLGLVAAVVLVGSFLSTTDGPYRLRPEPLDASALDTSALQAPPKPLNVSVLHPRTSAMPALVGQRLALSPARPLGRDIVESTQFFAQHGRNASGVHYKLRNTAIVDDATTLQQDALLVVVVLNDNSSWGPHRNSSDFFTLLASFTHATRQTSVAMLTSSLEEFQVLQHQMRRHIGEYAQFSLLFRNDFKTDGLSRENRHDDNVQRARRGMLARYRNFALLSTLETWHQHVIWLDADVHIVPPGLVTKMLEADKDILEPICFWDRPPGTHEYDRNAWAGHRAVPGVSESDTRLMSDYREKPDQFVALDSVGGTMLYVKADIHRQGVVFPHYYAIGTQWDSDGYDGIETEGLCYAAHFLGYTCWGMPHDAIYHAAS